MSGGASQASLVPRWAIDHRRPVVWVALGVLGVLVAVSVAVGYAARAGAQPFAPQDPIVFVGSAAIIAAYAFVFAILVQRVPANIVGWIFGAFAVAVAVGNMSWAYLTYATETSPPRLPAVEVSTLVGTTLIPWWTFLLIALIVSFPDGRPVSLTYGRLVLAAGVIAVVGSLAFAFASGPLPIWQMESPLALPGQSGRAMAIVNRASVVILMLLVVPAIWSLILRYRVADDIGRLQLKWFAFAGAVFLVCGLVFWLSAGAAYAPGSVASTAVWLVLCFGSIVVPVAAAVAILRYHLYDIETIISRTLVYGGLTAILAGIYTAAIRLFNALFVGVTGESSDAALVITTLILATTFTPIKTWLEGKVAARKGIIADPAVESAEASPVPLATTSGGAVELDDASLERLADLVADRLGRTAERPASS